MQFADFFVSSQSKTTPKWTMNIGKPIKTLCFIAVLLLATASRAATIGEERMAHLSMSDGLMGESVYQVMTGHDGIAWIATSNGVNVFNGKQMITIPVLDEQGRTVAVRDLCETKSHIIYAATDNGLYRIYAATGRFDRVLPEVQQPLRLLAMGDTVYIGSRQGLQYYDGHQLHHIDVVEINYNQQLLAGSVIGEDVIVDFAEPDIPGLAPDLGIPDLQDPLGTPGL